MRATHDGKPSCAVGEASHERYFPLMQATSRTAVVLRTTALLVLLATAGLWIFTGAHLGWTQTSIVTMQQDEITGIEYPVREAALVAGVEVPGGGVLTAATLAGLSLWRRRSAA